MGRRAGGRDARRHLARAPRGALPARAGLELAIATADLTVIALGRPDPSAGEYIAEIQRRLAAQDAVRYRMHAMGTSLEGSTEDILRVVGELHAVPFEMDVPRVYTVLKLDERRDRPDQTLDDKVASIERRLSTRSGTE
ncbi:MAG TPA: MTH1187 family thiamine-binding protein [Thermoleophilaceae bacterium]